MALLEVKNLVKRFGGIVAVQGLSFKTASNIVMGLVGPNGSGKTTVFNLISGTIKPDAGDILIGGESIKGKPPHQRALMGIGRTFQITRLFNEMSLYENLMVVPAAWDRSTSTQKARDLLKFVGLIDLIDEYAGNLSFGQRKLLELARVLMLDPIFLLLDEPIAGVNPVLTEEILKLLRKLSQSNKGVIIIEHNMQAIAKTCDNVVVLDHGEKIASGSPSVIQKDKSVIKAYLGSTG